MALVDSFCLGENSNSRGTGCWINWVVLATSYLHSRATTSGGGLVVCCNFQVIRNGSSGEFTQNL